ncbi:MAG TPA: hypothetical protein VGD40_18700 [Chryseosolibacter sp.]
MNKVKPGHIILYLTVVVLSVINYESDIVKFLFSGYSATYDVVMIRHSRYLIILSAVLLISLSIVQQIKKKQWLKLPPFFAIVFWLLSMRTAAYVETDGTLVSGWSFIRISSCKCFNDMHTTRDSSAENCNIQFDPILHRKLKEHLTP